MLSPALRPCLELQKYHILRALHRFSLLDEGGTLDEDAPLSANQVAHQQLHDLIEGTVLRGEGNSCLLLGPRGSGKTSLVNRCLSSLAEKPIVLQLSGWVHTTDRLALRDIAVQLNEQTGKLYLSSVEDELDGESNPFLDTQNANAATLSSGSLPSASHLPTLISLLPTLSRPTIVVLDAFDLFALHPRQSLLYCLLDTAQSCRAGAGSKGVAIIGVTSRMDSINLLEKRVKSRFSGRMIRTASPRELDDWLNIARTVLCSEIHPPADGAAADQLASWKDSWSSAVDNFLTDTTVLAVLNDTFSVTKDVRMLVKVLTHLVLHLSPQTQLLSAAQLTTATNSQRVHPSSLFLYNLPYPCVCLLVAAYHWGTAGHPNFTFEMLYESFRNQVRASSSAPVQINGGSIGMMRCSRPVAMCAFECLTSTRIFIPALTSNSSTAKEFTKYRCTLERDSIKKAVDKCGQINVKKWLNKA